MMIKKVLFVAVFVLGMIGPMCMIKTGLADSIGPEITDVYHIPKYPLLNGNVTVYATVTDQDGLNYVNIIYCDEVSCYMPITMTHLGDNVYSGTIPWYSEWENGTVIGYKIEAADSGMNTNHTEYVYYFIASFINLGTEIADSAYVDEVLTLNGTSYYNGNESAPVEFSNVTVRIIEKGNEYYDETDINGEFSIPLSFENYGEFHLNITIFNRTLVAHDEKTVFVTGISHLSENLQMTTCYPKQNIWVNGTSRYNTGEPVIYSPVKIYINETLIWIGETDSKGNYSILITAADLPGQYDVIVSITNGTLTKQNTTTLTVTEVPIADLVIRAEQLSFSSEKVPPIEGHKINISAMVHNLGTADCTDVTVDFYKGQSLSGNLIGSFIIPVLAVGQTKTAFIIWNATNGTHSILVVVDPENTVSESFETNNNATISIFVDTDTDSDGMGNLEDEDDDGDGLLDSEEIEKGTDPLNWDTDFDGVGDMEDYDPFDPKVTTEPSELPWALIIIAIAVVIVIIVTVAMFIRKKGQER